MRTFAILFFLALAPPAAHAAGECGWNATHTFFTCSGFSSSFSGASAPTVSDAIQQNPAALPTVPTSVQLEGTYVTRSAPGGTPKFTFNGIKGIQGLAFGVGGWNDGTFPAPDLDNYFSHSTLETLYRQTAPTATGARLAAALGFPAKLFPKGFGISAGLSEGYGHGAGSTAPLAGLQAILFGNLALGLSAGSEVVAPGLPRVNNTTFSAGTQLFGAHAGFQSQTLKSSLRTATSTALSLNYSAPSYAYWIARKWERDSQANRVTWGRFGFQLRLRKKFGVAYEYGMYQYSHGISLQMNL